MLFLLMMINRTEMWLNGNQGELQYGSLLLVVASVHGYKCNVVAVIHVIHQTAVLHI